MVINQIPLLMEMLKYCLEEEECVLLGNFNQELSNSSTKVVLIDHFIKVPEPVEKRFDNV